MTIHPTGLSGHEAERRRSHAETRWRKILLASALGMLFTVVGIGAIVALIARSWIEAFSWFTLVIGDWIPTPLPIMAILTVVGLALLVFSVLLAPPPDRRLPRSLRILTGVFLTLGVPASSIAVVLLGNNNFRILPEQSDGGCRIVIQRDWVDGTVGIVQSGSVTVGWIGDWFGDDFYDPFTYGTYSMTWQHRDGRLEVRGDESNPAGWDDRNSALHCLH